MLKVTITLDEYEPWSGAEHTMRKVMDEDALDDLDALLEGIYPDGISVTSLNDILRFEPTWVYESLGIDYDKDYYGCENEDDE